MADSPETRERQNALAKGTRNRKLLAALSEEADKALQEFARMLNEGEIDPEDAIREQQDIFIEAAVTPKGLRELGFGEEADRAR